METKIEKGIPLPSKRSGKYIELFEKMEVGDSFTVPLENGNHVSMAAIQWGKRRGKLFTRRKLEDNIIRIWRIK